jgi:transcription termination factor Rho
VSDTDTISTEQPAETAGAANGTPAKRRGGLTGMVLAELRQLAGDLNISNTAGMRKGDLISAIKEAQGAGSPSGSRGQLSLGEESATAGTVAAPVSSDRAPSAPAAASSPSSDGAGDGGATDGAPTRTRRRRTASRPAGAPDTTPDAASASSVTSTDTAGGDDSGAPTDAPNVADTAKTDAPRAADAGESRESGEGRDGRDRQRNRDGDGDTRQDSGRDGDTRQDSGRDGGNNRGDRDGGNNRDGGNSGGGNRDRDGGRQQNRQDNRQNSRDDNRQNSRDDEDDEDGGGRGRRGRRFRDRNRRGRDRRDGGGNAGPGNDRADTEVRDDDVLLPVAGILDVLDNYAFVRTSGYLSGPNDVYVSLSMVRRHGLRRGDNVSGVVRQPRDGEQQRQKFNPLVRVDTINGLDPDQSKNRPEFTKLTPLYPNERLRLETESHKLTTRVIDLVMPVGKGQRALIVSPPKAGKTTIMQNIANAITTNNPECHLMVVLVDERPEEVTDMQRSVKGEVIASTFDRPPADHTTIAELSIERAKRLVEMGHDVVVLLDNITRLGRAYNLAAPASGRILSGGVDSTALYPPKRFLGAARNIEDGGSLTIFATALVETGSTMDTVIFEEFKGTGNAELKLDRRIADKRVYPAIDVGDSGTRKEELLMAPDEHAVMVKLRRVLAGLDDQQAIDLLLTQLRKTRTNIEFLMQVAKNTPGANERD